MIPLGNIKNLLRPKLKILKPYQPIEPPDILSQRTDIAPENVIKLDGNENPYGCSDRIRNVLANYPYYHLYPDPEQRELRKALEKHTGLTSKHILVGAGSDELIDLILRLFIEPGDKVINCPPTFGMYQFSTEVCCGTIVNIPRRSDFSIDIPAIKKSLDKKAKVIFIASPNNPTGNITPEHDLIALLDSNIIVVIDEAYAEFSGISIQHLVPEYQNLIILRTFSKWAGLAGLRVGYGLFPIEIVDFLMKIKQPYNINVAAQIAAIESLKDIEHLRDTIKAIVEERERLISKLNEFSWLTVYPSKANFVLCSISNGGAKEIHQNLEKIGIFVRYFDTIELKNCLRISVGKPEHTDRLIKALHESY